MAVNVKVSTGDTPVEIFLQDGSQITVESDLSYDLQIAEGGFCTIGEVTVIEAKPEAKGHSFIQIMVKFWEKVLNKGAAPQRRDYKKESENG